MPLRSLVAASSDSQGALFWDWLRPLVDGDDEDLGRETERPGLAITVCVLLSVVLWLSLTLGEERSQTIRLPVEVVETPEGQALVERPPSYVQVGLEGRGVDLIRLLYNPPMVTVSATTGQVNVEEEINLPQGSSVQLQSVTPASFQIELGPVETRHMPVRNQVRIDLADAYELIGPPELSPDSVRVRGARSVISGMYIWPTARSQITNLQDTVAVEVPLQDTLAGLVEVAPQTVTLTARAGRFVEETQTVEVEVTGVPSGEDLVSLQPSTIRIRYRVLFRDMFKARRSSEFFATVSYDQIRSDTTGYVTPRVHVPPDLLIRDPEPMPSRLRYYTFVSAR
jgi:YbbR domain-containing protein